jgi:large subunit ribosomal protein L13
LTARPAGGKLCSLCGMFFGNFRWSVLDGGGPGMGTYVVKEGDIERRWWVIDADGLVLGRMASQIATLLRGKDKPIFTPSMDVGDHVVVVNADKVVLTGAKREKKQYYSHSRYPGGLKVTTAGRLMQTRPEAVVRLAVKRMLPRTKLGRAVLKKLKVYSGPDHPHQAQVPKPYTLGMRRTDLNQ